jgi:hypothetical protein
VTVTSSSPTEFLELAIDSDVPSTYQAVITASIPATSYAEAVIDLSFAGTAVMGVDYEVSTDMIIIPAGATSASATIEILSTGDIEMDDETIIVTAAPRTNFTITPFSETLTILGNGDYINDVLNLEFDWEGEVEFEDDFSSGVYNFCGMDFDFIVYDASFNDIGNTDAQTGACPEHLDIDGEWADGEYIITAYLWANPYAALSLGAGVPISVNFDQEFFSTSGTVVVEEFTTDTPANTEFAVARVTKNGTQYTVTPY